MLWNIDLEYQWSISTELESISPGYFSWIIIFMHCFNIIPKYLI